MIHGDNIHTDCDTISSAGFWVILDRRGCKSTTSDHDERLVVCTVGGTPMGTMTYNILMHRDLYIATLCAVTNSRIGSLLVEYAKRIATQRGLETIRLDARDDVAAFYERKHNQRGCPPQPTLTLVSCGMARETICFGR